MLIGLCGNEIMGDFELYLYMRQASYMTLGTMAPKPNFLNSSHSLQLITYVTLGQVI